MATNNRLNPSVPQRGASQSLVQVLDTYYRPARDVAGENAMSGGLGALSNFLGQQAAVEKEQELKQIAMKAQADAMAGADPDEEFANIRRGLLFRSHSRAYNQTYAETMGMKSAIEWKDNLTLEYEQSGLKRNTDPEAFRGWMNERVNTFIEGNKDNEYFMAGAMPYLNQTMVNMSSAHTSNIVRQMEANRIAAMRRQADDMAMSFIRGDMTPEELVANLQGVGTAFYETGESGGRVKTELLSSLLSVADATDNLDVLDIIDTAFSEGSLQLTPAQWNAISDARQGIQRDIEYRIGVQERLETRQRELEVRTATDTATDFYLSDPSNMAVSPQAFVSQNPDMAAMIAASPNSSQILTAINDAYKTVTDISTSLSPEHEAINDLEITSAIRSGDITDTASLVDWIGASRTSGNAFTESNITNAFATLADYNNPEGVYSTQTYKDFSNATEKRVVTGLVSAPEFSFMGDGYEDQQSLFVQSKYREYEAARVAAIPLNNRRDPAAIRQALEAAAQDTHDYFRQTDPDFYGAKVQDYAGAVAGGTIPRFTDPNFVTEIGRLAEAQRVEDAATAAEFNAVLTPDQQAAMIAEGNDLLGLGNPDPVVAPVDTQTPQTPLEQSIANAEADRQAAIEAQQAQEAAALAAEEARVAEADRRAVEIQKQAINEITQENIAAISQLVEQGRLIPAANRIISTFMESNPNITTDAIAGELTQYLSNFEVPQELMDLVARALVEQLANN